MSPQGLSRVSMGPAAPERHTTRDIQSSVQLPFGRLSLQTAWVSAFAAIHREHGR